MTSGTRRSAGFPPGWDAWVSYWTSVGEIAWAAPQVMAHRLAIAASGRSRTAAGRREHRRMVAEKGEAFTEAALAAWTAWPALTAAWFAQSLTPVHRRVVANRRRLTRTAARR